MTAPITGFGGRPLGLDIAGEGALRPSALPSAPSIGGPSFGDTLRNAINNVSEVQDTAQDTVQRFLRGDNVELHQVMAATEEAGIALEMLIEVRNKFTEAYRAVMNMQG